MFNQVEGAEANPYAGYGYPVIGDEFVGRSAPISSIRSRTFASVETAPISIVGPPRVGKSSLVKQALDRFAVGRSTKGLTFVPIWITVSGSDSEQSLFRELVTQVQAWMVDHDVDLRRLVPIYEALTQAISWDEMGIRLRTYLRQVRSLGYQIVAALDEFDAARNIFRRSAPFELLRAIAYDPSVRVALITVSRRELGEIVVRSTSELSTFPQIFGLPVTLGCFDSRELVALLGRSRYAATAVRDPLLEWLSKETGGQPYLASALLSVLHERWAGDEPPTGTLLDDHLRDAVVTCRSLTVNHHEQMLELLREERRLKGLLEILFGPQTTVGPLDAERLVREGIIRTSDSGWVAFSQNFQEYLSLLDRTSDDWPLWQKTETSLRLGVTAALEIAYGDKWLTRLTEAPRRLVKDCETRRRRVQVGFGEMAPDESLLEYAYPHELLSIITVHWEHLGPVLGRSREEWHTRLELIARMRTPMAHNRRGGSSPSLMELFREYCQEVLAWLAELAPAGVPAAIET